MERNKKIVVIGGGTGTTSVLNGLKKYSNLEIKVIVSMTDDGGSNAVVRDQFGLLPLSDLRKSIIALAETDNKILCDLFTYRFNKGNGLSGHTLGNLMMMGLSEIMGSEVKAIEAMSHLFNVKGEVIPVTLDRVALYAKYDNGEEILGEHLIDEPEKPKGKITSLALRPLAKIYEKAKFALEEADYIIAGPGDLYTTTLANIVVDGVPAAIQQSSAKYIFISNLMTKKGQTDWMQAEDLVKEISRYSLRQPDFVLVHKGNLNKDALSNYEKEGEFAILDNLKGEEYKVVKEDLVAEEIVQAVSGDTLKRSLIRHDADKLGKVLYSLFF